MLNREIGLTGFTLLSLKRWREGGELDRGRAVNKANRMVYFCCYKTIIILHLSSISKNSNFSCANILKIVKNNKVISPCEKHIKLLDTKIWKTFMQLHKCTC